METTTTYAESKGEKPFDWHAFLSKENKSNFEMDKARSLAYNWVTCACGNQCDVIPRSSVGWPLDEVLLDLGQRFASLVDVLQYKSAQSVLMEIEQRSAYLIAQINKKS